MKATTAVGAMIVHASKNTRNARRAIVVISTVRKFRPGRRVHSGSPSTFTLKYGITTSARTTSVGIRIPATNGGKKCSNSCRPRKYHGALAGFGVSKGLASCSRGASQKSAITTIAMTMISKTIASRRSKCGYVINCGPRSPTTFADVCFVTKTTRRGSFFASELKLVSIFLFSIGIFQLYRKAAVLLDTPEVDADQYERGERKNYHVQHVKTQERVFADDVSAEQEKLDLVSDDRHGRDDVLANRNGPKCQLVPGKQIASVAQEQRDQEQHHPNDPVEFMRRLVPTAIKHVKHVSEHHKDH